MKLKELLKAFDEAKIEETEKGCYKEMYCTILNENGEKKNTRTVTFKKSTSVENSLLNLELVSLDKLYKWGFMFSDGLKIYVTVK